MPNGTFPASSKLLQKKWEERAYQMHRQKMMSMRSDLSQYNNPKTYPHLVLRVKKVQKEEERQAQIDYENQLLIQKMTRIMKSRGTLDNWNDYQPRSLTLHKREREQERIAEENLEIAKRLEQVKPKYDVRDWEEEFQKHSYYLNMWANTTKDYSPLPKRKRVKASSRELNESKSSVDKSQDGYESDFEPDLDGDSEQERLPKIDSRQSTNREQSLKKKKESKVTKLPNINSKKPEARKLNKSKDSGRSEKNPTTESDAKLLFRATKKLADPDEVIERTLLKRSYAQRMATKKKFQELYEASLEDEMKELGKEYEVLVDCLLAKRESRDAETVNTLIHDNDVSGLINLFCSRNQPALNLINQSYQEKFDVTIKDDIEIRILSEDCQGLLVALLDSSKAKDEVNDKQTNEDAKALLEAPEGRFSEKNGKFLELLRTRSLAQIKAILNKYKSVAGGEDIAQSMKNDGCSKEYISAVQSLIKCMNTGALLNAEKIHSLLKSGKKKELIHLLMARAEIDMAEVNKAYKKKYGSDLSSDIIAKFGKPLGPLVAQITNKQGKVSQDKGSKGQGQNKGQSKAATGAATTKKSPEKHLETKKDGEKKNTAETPRRKGNEQNKVTERKNSESKESKGTEKDKGKDNKSVKTNESYDRGDNKTSQGSETDKRTDTKGATGKEGDGRNENTSKQSSNKENNNFDPESDVERIHEAVKGFGTNEQVLIDILAHRTNAQRQEILEKYKEKYDEDLIEVLKSELRSDFEEVTVALLMTPVSYDVYCLHDAIHGAGTREAALIGILCTRSNQDIKSIRQEYKKLHGSSLEDDLRGDTSGDFEEMLIELSKGEREQGNQVNQEKAEEDAKSLHEAGDLAEVHDLFRTILCKKNTAQVRATFEQYKKISGQSIEEAIKNASWSNKSDTVDGYVSLAEAIQDKIQFYAKRLQDAIEGLGTNDKQLIRIIVSRSEVDLADIAAKFQQIAGKSLKDAIQDETSGDYRKMLLALVDGM